MSLTSLLTSTIVIEKLSAGSADGMGGKKGRAFATWVSDVSARIQPLSGEERSQFGQMRSIVTHKIYIEPITNSDITAINCRIKYGTRYFDIDTVRNIDEQNRLITLECIERVGTT